MPVRRRSWQRGGAVVVTGMGLAHQPHQHSHHRVHSTRRRKHSQAKERPSSAKQEVSVCLKSTNPNQPTTPTTNGDSQLPLRVSLPPEKMADTTSSAKLFTMDQCCNKKLNELETTTDDNKTLNVEEFECGVSLAGSDKQEWSFTLYDFDGKGKITKEDLGSLLRSLYDAVGSSINLPKSGTKTLKLRLTVSPDHSKVVQRSPDEKRDKNDCRKEANNKTKESKLNKDLDNSKLSANKEVKLDNISKAEQLSAQAAAAAAGQEVKVHHKEVKNNLSQPGKATASSGKPKLTSIEQRHLAELVQKNMERHQQRLQQRHQKARRHTDIRKHHSHMAANNHTTCEESRDRRNYYLDLAGIENHDTAKLHNTSAPAELFSPRLGKREHSHRSRDAKLRSRSHNSRRQHGEGQATGQQENVHQRSRSHDVNKDQSAGFTKGEKEAVVDEEEQIRLIELAVEEKAEKCVPATTTTTTTSPNLTSTPNGKLTLLTNAKTAAVVSPTGGPSKGHKLRPVSLPPNIPETVSPHHHRRHRNRDRNRKLAMQQVAEWIEREHSWNCGEPGDPQHVVVQRHEHHHIHEHHHHHHYHHYHET